MECKYLDGILVDLFVVLIAKNSQEPINEMLRIWICEVKAKLNENLPFHDQKQVSTKNFPGKWTIFKNKVIKQRLFRLFDLCRDEAAHTYKIIEFILNQSPMANGSQVPIKNTNWHVQGIQVVFPYLL